MGRTVGTRVLERSIIKHLGKLRGVGVGCDFSVLGDGKTVLSMGFSDSGYDTSALSVEAKISTGEMALIRAINNFACSGATPKEMTVSIQAGESCPEQTLRDEMLSMNRAAGERGISIIGGNTVIRTEGDGCGITVSLFGAVTDKDMIRFDKKTVPEDLIFVAGYTGHMGASIAAIESTDKLRERLPFSYIKGALMDASDLESADITRSLIDAGAYYVHDITYGGVYRAILETGIRFGMGTEIIHEKLPIRQDTIEICEVLGLNPYEILGTGGVIGVCHPDEKEKIDEALKKLGVPYGLAGKLTVEKKRVVRSEKNPMERSITFYE